MAGHTNDVQVENVTKTLNDIKEKSRNKTGCIFAELLVLNVYSTFVRAQWYNSRSMPLQRRSRQSRRMTYTDKRKSATVVEDQPVSMRDLYESIFNSEGLQGRHDRVELCDAAVYRRRRPITKIFRNSKYIPSLDDIEETDESSAAENGNRSSSPTISLHSLHKERIRNTKGKSKRSRSRRMSTRSQTRSTMDTLSES